ncbi:hypothetical protein [Aeromonas enteropelogenes]|uniref:hypothetical protein n=1 Tax=Aeromonas enteropelogenes TaxID=29489 RepID=UPI003BA36CD0
MLKIKRKLAAYGGFLLAAYCNYSFSAETIYVDANNNCIGTNSSGAYYKVTTEKNEIYQLTLGSGDAVFNVDEGSKMGNVGVMYVEPPRKMKIATIARGEATYVTTEGNLYFFFVDNCLLNEGGVNVNIHKVELK